ncbi:MAG: hypothetical protein IPP72_08130 [Chitinophagaceae bacterium]|nr:hypothetical protein [Chitinophagaceae bacterium]
MSKRIFILALFITAAVLVIITGLTGCNQNKAATSSHVIKPDTVIAMPDKKIITAIQDAEKLLQDGDLVTRSDDDFESLTLQNFSTNDRSYSHSGIAFKEDSGFVIYHSMTGAENPSGICRRDPVDSFVNPVKKTGFGIFRYQLTAKEKEKLHAIVQGNHQASIPFDLTFNMNSNDSLYCSEMIYKGLKKATNGRVILPTTELTNFRPKIMGFKYNRAFLKKFEYISIDNLYINPFCKEIIRVKYR